MAASLTDPLTLMREFTIAKKPIALEGDHVVFGRTRFPRAAKTAYRNTGVGEGCYQIDSVWSILQNKKTAEYVKFCGLQKIPAVHLKDRKPLLAYLQGGDADSAAIDYSTYVAVQPVSADAAAESADLGAAATDVAPSADASSSSKPLVRPREPTAEEARQLEEGRKAFRRMLTQAIGASDAAKETSADADDGAEAMEVEVAEAATNDSGEATRVDKAGGADKGGKTGGDLKSVIAIAKPHIRHDREVIGAATRREQPMRSRSSILLAPTATSLPVLTAVLDGFRKRNKAQLDVLEKEARRLAKTGVTAALPPRNGGGGTSTVGAIPPVPAHLQGKSGGPTAGARGAPPGTAVAPGGVAPGAALPARVPRPVGGGGKLAGVAVLAVPAAITAIVNMHNVKDLLERSVYETAAERKAAGAVKETAITVKHTFEDGTYASFLVIDNPTTRLAANEWSQLVGVIVQGSTWQFKGWPYAKGETEIFAKVAGFYIRFMDEIPNQKTKGWAVTNLIFSREKTRAHEVGVMMTAFWTAVHKFMQRHKPHLLHKPGR